MFILINYRWAAKQIINRMFRQKKKEKSSTEKESQDEVKEVKNLLAEGKSLLEKEEFEQALCALNRALGKATSIQVANIYLLYYYRGLCYMNLDNLEKADLDFIKGADLADEKWKIQIYNAMGLCKVRIAQNDPSYLEDGIKCFQKAIECTKNLKNPEGEPYLNLANVYHQLGNNYRAIEKYTIAIEKGTRLHEAYTQRGLCYRDIGEIENSVSDFLKALEIDGEDANAHFNLGVNYLIMEKSNLAEESFDQAIEFSDEKPQYYNYKGLALYMSGQYEQCLPVYEHTLKLYHQHKITSSEVAECWYNLANVYLKIGNHNEGIRSLENARQFEVPPELNLKIYYAEGLAYQNLEDILAIAKFRECERLIGSDDSHQLFESTFYHLGTNLHRHKKYDLAAETLSRLIKMGCADQCVYQLRGKVYLDAQMYEEALKDFGTILSMNANYPQVYYFLGRCKSELGDIEPAICDFFKAFELGSRSTSILNGVSCAYLKSGRPEKALVYSKLALEREPENEDFLIQRSMIYIQLGQNMRGIRDLTQAAKINPENPFIYYQRGYSYYKSGQFESAIEDLNKAFDYFPSRLIESDIHYLIGISYANLEEFGKAVSPLSSAIALKPLSKYYHERAKCFLLLEKHNEALADLNKVISEQPENAFAYFRRAFAHKALKKYQEAADDFLKARQLSPEDPRLIVNKKQIYSMKYRKLCEAGEQQ